MDPWHSLDDAAHANIPAAWREFMRYRNELRAEGVPWGEAEGILRGFIWNEIEANSESE